MTTKDLSTIRKAIEKKLTKPNNLFWSFDSQDRGGQPFRIFLDLDYGSKAVVIEWRSFQPNEYGISLLGDKGYGEGHDFWEIGIDATVNRTMELLEPHDTADK